MQDGRLTGSVSRRPRNATRLTAWLALALAFTPLAAFAQGSTLVYIVRHAEKAAQPANDPPLSPEGEARARVLATTLAAAGISAIISTPYARTRMTVAPLATQLGLPVDTVQIPRATAANMQETGTPVQRHANAVAEAVRRHAGKAVLVVGHSNTIMPIAAALGAPKLPDLCDGDYDQLLVLELVPGGATRFVRTRFGAPAVDGSCK